MYRPDRAGVLNNGMALHTNMLPAQIILMILYNIEASLNKYLCAKIKRQG
jgi:hypothetical protein